VNIWHLAQFNIAKTRYPLDDPRMQGFTDQLDPVNQLGDRADGFVWRHHTEDGDSTAVRMFEDPDLIINFTVWQNIEALRNFTYHTAEHKELLRKRRQWFVPVIGWPGLVMWWIPANHLPTLQEAKKKLAYLRDNGPSHQAFTFRTRFNQPGAAV
jgi:hypothetical protein